MVGKNTIALLAIRLLTEDAEDAELKELQKKYPRKPHLKNLEDKIKNKVAFIFTETPYIELKDPIEKEVVKVPAKPGIIAPDDVWVRAGPTAIDPGKFGEFQRLGIQTKTARQSLEIQKDAKICTKGELVTETVSAMCRMLNIIPFEYGMKIQDVYLNQQFIPKDIIDLPADSIGKSFENVVRDITSLSLEANLVNELSMPHALSGAFKSVLSIALGADIKLPILDKLAAAPAAKKEEAPKAADKPAKEAPKKKEEPKEEPKEEVDFGLGDMF